MTNLVKRLRDRDQMIAAAHERKLGKKLDPPFTLEGLAADEIERLQAALLSAKANMLDHQGCIMPPHLMDAVVREIDAAITAGERTDG